MLTLPKYTMPRSDVRTPKDGEHAIVEMKSGNRYAARYSEFDRAFTYLSSVGTKMVIPSHGIAYWYPINDE